MCISIEQAKRIWLDSSDSVPDAYVRFRRDFELQVLPLQAQLFIVADTEFALCVNGKRVPATQFPDYPDKKTFSTIDITSYLKPGKNVIAVLVYHLGYGNATHPYCSAGLRLAVEISGNNAILSDQSWRASSSESYASGKQQLLSAPIGFRFYYDAASEEDWTSIDYDDSTWKNATVLPCPDKNNNWAYLSPRPIPFLIEKEPQPVKVIWQGETIQFSNHQEGLKPDDEAPELFLRYRFPEKAFIDWQDCWNCTRDETSLAYPVELHPGGKAIGLASASKVANGLSVIIDLGRETAGFLAMELECGQPFPLAAMPSILTISFTDFQLLSPW